MNLGISNGTKRVLALGSLWQGLDMLTSKLPSNTIFQFPNLPITIVPVLRGVVWLWFFSFVCAIVAEFGGFGETTTELFDDSSKMFLLMVPFEILWLFGAISLAMTVPWVWNYFTPLFLSGTFAIYFGFTRKYWGRLLRVYYDTGVKIFRWVQRRRGKEDFPDTIPI